MSTQDSPELHLPADTLTDGFDDDPDWEVAPPPRRRLHWTTAFLIVALIVVAAFAGGILAQKHWGGSSSSGFALPNGGNLPTGFPGVATGGATHPGGRIGSRLPAGLAPGRLRRRHPRHRQLRRRQHPLRLHRIRQRRQSTRPERPLRRSHREGEGLVDPSGRDRRRAGDIRVERNRDGDRRHRDRGLGSLHRRLAHVYTRAGTLRDRRIVPELDGTATGQITTRPTRKKQAEQRGQA